MLIDFGGTQIQVYAASRRPTQDGRSGPKPVVHKLRPHQARAQAITYENGCEFSVHAGMAKDLDARIYFAHQYASWEQGVNETTNGLIRQFFSKNRDLTHVTEHDLKEVMATLNHRPRKTLGYRTPPEISFGAATKWLRPFLYACPDLKTRFQKDEIIFCRSL